MMVTFYLDMFSFLLQVYVSTSKFFVNFEFSARLVILANPVLSPWENHIFIL